MYTGGFSEILITVDSLRVWPGIDDVEAALPLRTPTRRSELRIDDLPTLGIPAIRTESLSVGESSGRSARPAERGTG